MLAPKKKRKTWRKKRGRPKQLVPPSLKEVYELIPEDRPISLTELIQKAKASGKCGSLETLYKVLKLLEGAGTIFRTVDASTYPARVYYTRKEIVELASPPQSREDQEHAIRMSSSIQDAVVSSSSLAFWNSVLAECAKREPNKFRSHYERVRAEVVRSFCTNLNFLALVCASVMMRVSKIKGEKEKLQFVRIASEIYLMPLVEKSAILLSCDPSIWQDVGRRFFDVLKGDITDEKLRAQREMEAEALKAVQSLEGGNLLLMQYGLDESNRIERAKSLQKKLKGKKNGES